MNVLKLSLFSACVFSILSPLAIFANSAKLNTHNLLSNINHERSSQNVHPITYYQSRLTCRRNCMNVCKSAYGYYDRRARQTFWYCRRTSMVYGYQRTVVKTAYHANQLRRAGWRCYRGVRTRSMTLRCYYQCVRSRCQRR